MDFFIAGLFKPVIEFFKRIFRIFFIPKAFSWQTLLYLSFFSLIMWSISQGVVANFIGFCGWVFLILATSWYTTDNPIRIFGIPLGALITGYLVSVFAFGGGRLDQAMTTPRSFVWWPTVTALITAVPKFIESGKGKLPSPEVRQLVIIQIGIGMVISCWLQFGVVVNNWLNEYPSLQSDNFNQSTFVKRLPATIVPQSTMPQNGVNILNGIQPLVVQQLDDKPWAEVERWLIEAQERVGALGTTVIDKKLAEFDEKSYWRVEPRVTNVNSGYNLQLLSIWSGPSSNSRRYYVSRSCRITPATITTTTSVVPARKPQQVTVARVSCDRTTKMVPGTPPPRQQANN